MQNTIFIDTKTGEGRTALGGTLIQRIKLFARDIVPLRITFVTDGVASTTTILAAAATMKIGIRSKRGQGSILALATSYTISGEAALVTLSLNTAEVVAFFSDVVPENQGTAECWFEVEVIAADESTRVTYYQELCTVAREVNIADDTNPAAADVALYVLKSALFDSSNRAIAQQFPAFRSEILGIVGGSSYLDGITTTTLTVPFLVVIYVSSEVQWWVLKTGTTASDGVGTQRPLDYNGSTNTKIWQRVS